MNETVGSRGRQISPVLVSPLFPSMGSLLKTPPHLRFIDNSESSPTIYIRPQYTQAHCEHYIPSFPGMWASLNLAKPRPLTVPPRPHEIPIINQERAPPAISPVHPPALPSSAAAITYWLHCVDTAVCPGAMATVKGCVVL